MDDLILTLNDALTAVEAGVYDWPTLTRNLGRNDLPYVLVEVAWRMSAAQLARAVTQAWVMCEFPEQAIDRDGWAGVVHASRIYRKWQTRKASRNCDALPGWCPTRSNGVDIEQVCR